MEFSFLSDISMDTSLDKRLNMEHDRTVFIKVGIETLVTQIIEELDSELSDLIRSLLDEFKLKNPNYQSIDRSGEKILKVGSFYEDTKIIFPDEFDFIYVIATFIVVGSLADSMWKKHYFILNKFHDDIKRVITEQFIDRKIAYESEQHFLQFEYYDRSQGPSSKLLFTYVDKANVTDKRSISVDVVSAFEIFDDHHLQQKLKRVCNVEGFVDEVMQTKSYLITNEISFTEAELHCMKNTLSKEHLSVYRVLKFMINGDGDGEELRKYVTSAGISTYMLKVVSIKHHFTCSGYQKESQCLLDILGYLLVFFSEDIDNKILCKFNGSPFNIVEDDRPAIVTWLQNTILKYKKRFRRKVGQAKVISLSSIEFSDYGIVSSLSSSSVRLVTLSRCVKDERESLASNCSIFEQREEHENQPPEEQLQQHIKQLQQWDRTCIIL